MRICIFSGPSVQAAEITALLPDALCLPPVQQGSVYAALTQHAPQLIAIIDGFFQQTSSVWHKEILWALSQGVHVYGAASMGALRAAELEPFGMIGSGAIFDAYKRGTLPPFDGISDDDEVAVAHGPAELGYLAVSDALVNIRFTLAAAVRERVIDNETSQKLLGAAKVLYFPLRNYERVFASAEQLGVSADSLQRLRQWLPRGAVDQKKTDALELLQLIAAQQQELPAFTAPFHFETTEIWTQALPGMLQQGPRLQGRNTSDKLTDKQIIDELRLHRADYTAAKKEALLRYFLLTENQPALERDTDDDRTAAADLRRVTDRIRVQHALYDRAAIDRWLEDNDLALEQFDQLAGTESLVDALLRSIDTGLIESLLSNELRLNGHYPALAARARHKQRLLQQTTDNTAGGQQLYLWYFEQQCNERVPDDMADYARQLGLPDEQALIRLLQDHYRYLKHNSIDNKTYSGDS